MGFQKGQSGNPAGRNPKTTQLKRHAAALLSPHQKTATKAIVDCLSDDEASVRLQAAKIVFEYSFGKPAQAVNISGEDGGPLVAVIREVIKGK